MALDWYRTPEWSEQDELRLKRRLAAQRGYSGRAFALRVKASILEKTGDPRKREIAERLLRLVVEDQELELARTSHAIACEVSSAFDALGRMADRAGDPIRAEEYFRQAQSFSLTPGTGLTLAFHLARSDDRAKLEEADRLLDEVEATKTPPQLLFATARIRYAVARARICATRGAHGRAAEFAKVALGVAEAGGIDSFKRKPMDNASLEPEIASEMLALVESANQTVQRTGASRSAREKTPTSPAAGSRR